MLKLVVLAICIGGVFAVGFLVYPDQLNRVFADFENNSRAASSGDDANFFTSGSPGFATGFHLLQLIFGTQAAIRKIEADRIEVRTVSSPIVGPIFLWGGCTLLATIAFAVLNELRCIII